MSYRMCDNVEQAAKSLLNAAEVCKKDGVERYEECEQFYRDAIEAYEDGGKNHLVTEIYREFEGFLFESKRYDSLREIMDKHIAILVKSNSLHFAYKEVLAQVILTICIQDDVVSAEEAMNTAVEKIPQWLGSDEFGDAQDFIDSVKTRDKEKFDKIKKKSAFQHTRVEFCRIFKTYQLNMEEDLC